MTRGSPGQSVATIVLVVVIAATLVRAWDRLRSSPEPPTVTAPVSRPDVGTWDMPGCYALRVQPWEWAGSPDTAEQPLPGFLTVPTRVRLLPDSTDEWRRSMTTYRAVPITGDHDPRIADYLRWFVRADTLWLLWSDGKAGGGIALRQVGDSLLGRARAFDRVRDLDGTAAAAAWRLNCYTLERERTDRRPRR